MLVRSTRGAAKQIRRSQQAARAQPGAGGRADAAAVAAMSNVMALPSGTELVGDFRIDRVLGAGGFGITYLAEEMALARSVTIKEYFPSDFAARNAEQGAVPRSSDCAGDYKWGLDRFIEEAQTLARFDHRNICRVYRYFRANNTGYMVLQFEQGASLKSWLKGLGRAPRQAEIDKLVAPLLDALEVIHKADFLHRDIAPDNIMVRKDGSPVLIDFGSARGDIARHSRTVSALVKPGYSPYEQYAETGARQGPWTDIYAFAATLYHAITGKRPPDSPSRIVKDEYISAKDAALAAYRPRFLTAIDRALELDIERRPRSVAAWRGDLLAPEPKPARKGWLADDDDAPPKPKSKSKEKTVVLAPVEGVPPPPDAPGPKGGILDFFEGLKKKAEPKPGGSVTAQLAEPPPPPSVQLAPRAAAAVKATPAPAKTVAAKVTPPAPPPAPPPAVEAAKPRPRPVKAKRTGAGRRMAVVVLLAAGIASAAYGLRERLPKVEMRRGIVSTSSTSKPAVEPLAVLDLKGHTGGTAGLGFAGDQIVTAGVDGSLKVWSGSGSLLRTIAGPGPTLNALAVLGRRAVAGYSDGTAILWDLDRGERVATFKHNEASIWAVAFAGTPDRIVTGSHDWSAAIWDAANPTAPSQVFEEHESAVQAVAFSAAKALVASAGADRTLKIWNAETRSLVRSYRGHKDFVTAVDFSADGRLVASAGLDGSIRVWSTASSRHVATLNGHRGRVNALAFAPSGELLASVGDDGALRLWEARRGRLVRLFAAGSEAGGALKAVAFSSNGRRLVVGGEGGTVKVRDIEASASTARAGRE
jgi:serine/threonine protein kinase